MRTTRVAPQASGMVLTVGAALKQHFPNFPIVDEYRKSLVKEPFPVGGQLFTVSRLVVLFIDPDQGALHRVLKLKLSSQSQTVEEIDRIIDI